MNKIRQIFFLSAIAALLLCVAGSVRAQKQATSATDDFFIISSVDKAHNALILLRPNQLTATIGVTDKTQLLDDQGKPMKLADLRTGDTIFINYTSKPDGTMTASRVRMGVMTMAEMRKRYMPGLPVVSSPAGLGH